MNSDFVDFHCHLDLFPDPAAAIQAAEDARIHTLTVTTTPKAWPRNRELTRSTRFVRAALGLHPQLIPSRSNEVSLWEEYLPQARYVGEVGIDAGPRYYRSLDLQKEVFEHILRRCAAAGGKILTVHSVRAGTIVLDLIEKHLTPENSCVVLHWFTGSNSEARRAVDLGCYFSINSQMLSNQRGRDLVARMPLHRVLTETDSPFTKLKGRPTRPFDVTDAVDSLAGLRKIPATEITAAVCENLRDIVERTSDTL